MLIDHYEWSGGREAMLRFGPGTGPVVVVAMPLFEEANRMRAFAVTLCRALAKRGVASALPDLPGQGESLIATADTTLTGLREGLRAAVDMVRQHERRVYTASLRSGILLDVDSATFGRCCLAPVSSDDLIRQLARLLDVTGRKGDALQLRNVFQYNDDAFPLEVSGNLLGATLLQDLTTDRAIDGLHKHGVPLRTIRLDGDPAAADRYVPGAPLWRRAEPDDEPALAALLADDIADWITVCEG